MIPHVERFTLHDITYCGELEFFDVKRAIMLVPQSRFSRLTRAKIKADFTYVTYAFACAACRNQAPVLFQCGQYYPFVRRITQWVLLVVFLHWLVTCMLDSSTFPLNKWSLAFFFQFNVECSLLRSRYSGRHVTLLPKWEEHCVTTLITAAKETMLNDTFVCLLLYAAWTCFRTDDVRQLRCSSHVTFVCHTDKDTLQR